MQRLKNPGLQAPKFVCWLQWCDNPISSNLQANAYEDALQDGIKIQRKIELLGTDLQTNYRCRNMPERVERVRHETEL